MQWFDTDMKQECRGGDSSSYRVGIEGTEDGLGQLLPSKLGSQRMVVQLPVALFESRSHVSQANLELDFALEIFLPPPPGGWRYRLVPYVVLVMAARSSCLLDPHSSFFKLQFTRLASPEGEA